MISMMELMEKKTLSIKNTNRKKGMTLVEIMAAMAKSSLTLFDVKSANVENYIVKKTINFDDLDDMQNKIKNINSLIDNEGKFSIDIIAELQDNGLYKVTAYMKNKSVEDTKIIIVNK